MCSKLMRTERTPVCLKPSFRGNGEGGKDCRGRKRQGKHGDASGLRYEIAGEVNPRRRLRVVRVCDDFSRRPDVVVLKGA